MKRSLTLQTLAFVALTSVATVGASGCSGSFGLFHKVQTWNGTLGDKWINSVVHAALWIIPAYELVLLGDLLLLNTIEFWTGSNPVTASASQIVGEGANEIRVAVADHDIRLLALDADSVAVYIDGERAGVARQEPAGDWVLQDHRSGQTLFATAEQAETLRAAVLR